MNAAESNMYVHYWFDDYEKSAGPAGDLYKKYNKEKYFGKEGLLKPILDKRINALNSGDMSKEDFGKLIEFLSDDSSGLRKQVFEGNVVNNISTATMLRTSKESVIGDAKIAEATAEEIAMIANDFFNKLNAAISDMYNTIIGSGSWEAFQAKVIQEFAEKRSNPSDKISESVLKTFLTHNGLKKMDLKTTVGNELDATLQSCLRNIALILDALPDYSVGGSSELGSRRYSTGSTKGKYKISGSGGDTLGIISGKLQGLFSNLVGKGGEIAWKIAEKAGEKEVQNFLDKETVRVNADVIGGDTFQIEKRTSSDGSLKENTSNNTTKVVSKGDTKVTITEGEKVLIEYGVSVKTYNLTKAGSKTVSIVDGTNFFDTAAKLFGTDNGWRYMLNLGAGHAGRGLSERETITSAKKASELNAQWDELVNQIVANAFLDLLMGVVTKEGPDVLYLVVNGNIIKISDILAKLADGSIDFSKRVWQETERKSGGAGSRALTRAALVKINEWHWAGKSTKTIKQKDGTTKEISASVKKDRDREKAVERSNKVVPELYSRLKQQKITVSLNHLEALGV